MLHIEGMRFLGFDRIVRSQIGILSSGYPKKKVRGTTHVSKNFVNFVHLPDFCLSPSTWPSQTPL